MADTDWTTYRQLAEAAEEAGEYEDAESLWFAALQTVEFDGESDPRLTITLGKLAHICFCQRKYSQAENLYWECITLQEQQVGAHDLSIGRTLKGLAAVYYEQGLYDQAELSGRRALEIYEEALGPYHIEVSEIALNLAALYHKLKNVSQAQELYQRALDIKAMHDSQESNRVVSPFSHRTGKPPSICDVCGRPYNGAECLKCTQTRLDALNKPS